MTDAPDKVWAVDFQFDTTTDGRPIKIVSIFDEHTRESQHQDLLVPAHARVVITDCYTTRTTADETHRSAAKHRRSTLRPKPTDERLSHELDQFSGSGDLPATPAGQG
jgi:hypothetical protein